jgi:hypothetical protein
VVENISVTADFDIDPDTNTGEQVDDGNAGVNETPSETSSLLKIAYDAVGDRTRTTATFNKQKLDSLLDAMSSFSLSEEDGKNKVINARIPGGSDIVIVELTGQMVKDMEQRRVLLKIGTDRAIYDLPAKEINISSVSDGFGKDTGDVKDIDNIANTKNVNTVENVDLSDIKVRIEISKPGKEEIKAINSAINKNGRTAVLPPVEFHITCTYSGKIVEVDEFEIYIKKRFRYQTVSIRQR